MRKLILSFFPLGLGIFSTSRADEFSSYNISPGVTPISHDIYQLHMAIFWICVGIGLIVFSVLIYTMIVHRKSRGHIAAEFHEHLFVEIIWAVIPFIILVIMAIPATIVLIRMENTAEAEVNIRITGYQWKWKYEYLDYGISFFSNLSTPSAQLQGKEPRGPWYLLEVDKPLVLPTHKKIRFFVTSNDVIHSWWVPALGIKRDAIPGFIYESWATIERPGTYRGQCAELCGLNHGFMPIVVIAKTPDDFNHWVASQAQPKQTPAKAKQNKMMTKEQLMAIGKKTYESICLVCHKADGMGTPPVFPSMVGAAIVTGPLAAHIDIVLNGKKGTAMQGFKDQLTDEQLAGVITYERNSWGNDDKKYGSDAGGVIQSNDIAHARTK